MSLRPSCARLFIATVVLVIVFASGYAAGQRSQPPTTDVVDSEEMLQSLNLTGELESGKGRPLRMRRLTVQPGGVIALHNHVDRPAVTSHATETVSITRKAGPTWFPIRARVSPKAARRLTGARTPERCQRYGSRSTFQAVDRCEERTVAAA